MRCGRPCSKLTRAHSAQPFCGSRRMSSSPGASGTRMELASLARLRMRISAKRTRLYEIA